MSSSWTERQGQVGDLSRKSTAELHELLLRQEKLLSNKQFLQGLPDKGKKISDFAERIRFAIEQQEEEEGKYVMLTSLRTTLESKYQQAFAQQQGLRTATGTSGSDGASHAILQTVTSPGSSNRKETANVTKEQKHVVSKMAAGEAMETVVSQAPLSSDRTKEGDLVEAMQKVGLSDEAASGLHGPSRDTSYNTKTQNYFLKKQPQKKPHYIEVLEKAEGSGASQKQKFKPNLPLPRTDISPSGSSPPSHSQPGPTPLSAQARKERDRKHLDDITAAKLPPLHHSPAQLLSLDESAILLREQNKKQQELQARLAAQKLSEGLRINMGEPYTPDDGAPGAYREVHDDGAQLSSEED